MGGRAELQDGAVVDLAVLKGNVTVVVCGGWVAREDEGEEQGEEAD